MPSLGQNQILFNSDGSSPNTGSSCAIRAAGGTPTIIEEKEFDESEVRQHKIAKTPSSQNGSLVMNRASNFSLSNAADVNPDNGEITPLRTVTEIANLTNDDIMIESGSSDGGVCDRNNPFE